MNSYINDLYLNITVGHGAIGNLPYFKFLKAVWSR